MTAQTANLDTVCRLEGNKLSEHYQTTTATVGLPGGQQMAINPSGNVPPREYKRVTGGALLCENLHVQRLKAALEDKQSVLAFIPRQRATFQSVSFDNVSQA